MLKMQFPEQSKQSEVGSSIFEEPENLKIYSFELMPKSV